MFGFLPKRIQEGLSAVNPDKLFEVRIRKDRPVCVGYGGDTAYLTPCGLSLSAAKAFTVSGDELAQIVFELCDRSVYSHTDKIAKGFVTLPEGVRVGLCGECVTDGERITNIKNITSVNIRLPHAVKGCSDKVMSHFVHGVLNTIVISPPGVGKTTLVRDIAERLSSNLCNVLIADERNEIFPLMTSRDTVDAIVYAPKKYAFENGIRSMSPDVIITDELMGRADLEAVAMAERSGVKVIATVHGVGVEDVDREGEMRGIIGLFELAVVLGGGRGRIKEIRKLGENA